MNISSLFLLSLFLWGLGVPAQARVFNMKNEKFAPYLRASYSPLSFENTLSSGSHGANTTLQSKVPYNLAGELGFIYNLDQIGFRFGLEIIHPPDSRDENGTSSTGVSHYSMTSEISVISPKLGIDINLKSWNIARLYTGVAAGYASLAARNSYAMTTAGSTAYSGLSSFDEDLRSGAPLYEGLIGFETLFNDSTTLAIEAVYRSLVFKDIKHNKDGTNFRGAFVKGDAAFNDDGSSRVLNLSQFYIGISSRFWIY